MIVAACELKASGRQRVDTEGIVIAVADAGGARLAGVIGCAVQHLSIGGLAAVVVLHVVEDVLSVGAEQLPGHVMAGDIAVEAERGLEHVVFVAFDTIAELGQLLGVGDRGGRIRPRVEDRGEVRGNERIVRRYGQEFTRRGRVRRRGLVARRVAQIVQLPECGHIVIQLERATREEVVLLQGHLQVKKLRQHGLDLIVVDDHERRALAAIVLHRTQRILVREDRAVGVDADRAGEGARAGDGRGARITGQHLVHGRDCRGVPAARLHDAFLREGERPHA